MTPARAFRGSSTWKLFHARRCGWATYEVAAPVGGHSGTLLQPSAMCPDRRPRASQPHFLDPDGLADAASEPARHVVRERPADAPANPSRTNEVQVRGYASSLDVEARTMAMDNPAAPLETACSLRRRRQPGKPPARREKEGRHKARKRQHHETPRHPRRRIELFRNPVTPSGLRGHSGTLAQARVTPPCWSDERPSLAHPWPPRGCRRCVAARPGQRA